MADVIVRPTLKFIHAAYVAEAVLMAASFVVQHQVTPEAPLWAPVLPGVLVIWTIARHIGRLAVKVTVSMDKLRHELGILSK